MPRADDDTVNEGAFEQWAFGVRAREVGLDYNRVRGAICNGGVEWVER